MSSIDAEVEMMVEEDINPRCTIDANPISKDHEPKYELNLKDLEQKKRDIDTPPTSNEFQPNDVKTLTI